VTSLTTIPSIEPDRVALGDSWVWKRYFADFLPATWTLTYALVNASGQIAITASDNGDGFHLVEVAAATTAGYTAGTYNWQAYVTSGTERYQVGRGVIEVKSNYAVEAGGLDDRSHVKATLDALEATILGKASKDQRSVTLNGVSLESMSSEDLLNWYDRYKTMYQQELDANKIAAGLGSGRRILTRFTK